MPNKQGQEAHANAMKVHRQAEADRLAAADRDAGPDKPEPVAWMVRFECQRNHGEPWKPAKRAFVAEPSQNSLLARIQNVTGYLVRNVSDPIPLYPAAQLTQARRDTLEEAAKYCDSMADQMPKTDPYEIERDSYEGCATELRRMAEAGKEGG